MAPRFPGMDPFIEGQLWTDFHAAFINGLRVHLMPRLEPPYVAVIEQRLYVERAPDPPLSVQPDVTIVGGRTEGALPGQSGSVAIAPVTVPLLMPQQVRETFLTIRRRGAAEVITVIELLSPGNKRAAGDGRREYLQKRESVLQSAAHLVEVDLLRAGERLPMALPLPPAHYYVIISRAERRPLADVWPLSLPDPLPTVPVPLAVGASAVCDLEAVFRDVYTQAGYDRILDYGLPLAPPMADSYQTWVSNLLA